jgi:cysteine-rich repeat protein
MPSVHPLNFHINTLIAAACLAAVTETHAQTTSAFWTKARDTLKLSELRAPASTLVSPSIKDPVLSLPNWASPYFLPLCGNGRIDTKADYAAFYKATKHPPLQTTLTELFVGQDLSQNPNATQPFGLTIAADEECDDGNRNDFDGCSADCMHTDLWTSACGLALDRALTLEDLLYDPVRECMVLSASDGVYALKVGLGDTTITTVLLAPKKTPMVKIYRQANSILLYSSDPQSLWQLPDGGSAITLLRSLPELDNVGLTYPRLDAFYWEDGSIVVRDEAKMMYLESATSSSPQLCSFGKNVSTCRNVLNQGKNKGFHCDFHFVEVGPGRCFAYEKSDSFRGQNIWYDLFQHTGSFTSTMKFSQRYAFGDSSGNFDRVELQKVSEFVPNTLQAYVPMGGFIEVTLGDPRKIKSENKNLMPYFIGDPSVLQALLAGGTPEQAVCSTNVCPFDNSPDFDITLSAPSKSMFAKTWNGVLQEIIDAEANASPKLSNLKAIYDDPARYKKVVEAFMKEYVRLLAPLAVVSIVKHPVTKSIWVLGGMHGLVEISTSGVQVRRSDGLCMPSGVALCSECEWAPSGHPCRPCSQADANSWSWNAACAACPKKSQTSQSGRRRLLADTASGTTITFVLKGDLASVKAVWPEAVYDPSNGFITVNSNTIDVVGTMKIVKAKLLDMPGVIVITPPYVAVEAGKRGSADGGGAGDNTAVIVLAIVLPCLLIVGVVSIYAYSRTNGQNRYRVVPSSHGPGQGPPFRR